LTYKSINGENILLKRKDLQIISEIIEPHSKVLDLGCGDGHLLNELIKAKKITGLGIEISIERIKKCLERGLSVVQEDLNEGLKDFQDKSFDYVILSQTLEDISRPLYLLLEMVRVGKKCIISFDNVAFWMNRMSFFLKGEFSKNRSSRKQQFLTIKIFQKLCKIGSIKICRKILLPQKSSRLLPNLFCRMAIFILRDSNIDKKE
jgi:methionine biosynthesis protein MetW